MMTIFSQYYIINNARKTTCFLAEEYNTLTTVAWFNLQQIIYKVGAGKTGYCLLIQYFSKRNDVRLKQISYL